MKKEPLSTVTAENNYTVQGTVRNQQQQPIPELTDHTYNKGIRGQYMLRGTSTDTSGDYTISYTLEKVATAAVMICVYDDNKVLLKESSVQFNGTATLHVDLRVDANKLASISFCEALIGVSEIKSS